MEKVLHEKKILETILERSPNLIVVFTKTDIILKNKRFQSFFKNSIDNTQTLLSKIVIRNNQVPKEINSYSIDKLLKYLVNNSSEEYTIMLLNNEEQHYFILRFDTLLDGQYLINLQDITQLKEKETLLLKQSKMESMAEMLNNIAHQWRQPLSMISTLATGLEAQHEMGILNDEKLINSLESINKSTQYVSNIIDEFSSFYHIDKEKKYFKNTKLFDKVMNLLDNNIKSNVRLVFELNEHTIYGYENEIVQVVFNMLDNAKEILFHREIKNKIIKISSYDTDTHFIISIHDNANGIPEELKSKVFEPYFTTKFQKQKVGIGLYMSYELIKYYMAGDIEVLNEEFTYDNNTYYGANFIIILPKE